jgi:hypothetical protein
MLEGIDQGTIEGAMSGELSCISVLYMEDHGTSWSCSLVSSSSTTTGFPAGALFWEQKQINLIINAS